MRRIGKETSSEDGMQTGDDDHKIRGLMSRMDDLYRDLEGIKKERQAHVIHGISAPDWDSVMANLVAESSREYSIVVSDAGDKTSNVQVKGNPMLLISTWGGFSKLLSSSAAMYHRSNSLGMSSTEKRASASRLVMSMLEELQDCLKDSLGIVPDRDSAASGEELKGNDNI